MKKTTKTVALFAVLSMVAAGCQKDGIENVGCDASVTEMCTVYTVQYTVNGVQHRKTLYGEAERSAFLYQMISLAEQGYNVSFFDESKVSSMATKDIVYYSTTDKNEAYAWASDMVDKGYKVSVSFDTSTNTYNCVAWK